MCKNISREDLYFFKEMLESGINRLKNYSNFIKNKSSRDYERFIQTYQLLHHLLSEREKHGLDLIYGINCSSHKLKEIAQKFAVSHSRICQIRNNAERKQRKEIYLMLHPEENKRYFLDIIIKNQSDETLLKIVQATRPWEPIIKQFFDKGPTYNRRKKLEHIVYRMWIIGALDHLEKTIEILNVKKEEVTDFQ